MANIESTGSIQDSSTDYELIQPRDERLRRGYSFRGSIPPHMKLPHPRLPPAPHRQRCSSGRQRFYHLSNSRQRNYAGLHGTRNVEGDYAVPTPQRTYTASNAPSHVDYDGFFRGSLDERNEDDDGEDRVVESLVSEPEQDKPCFKCSCVTIKHVLCFITISLNLLISLAALGLVLYMMFRVHTSSQCTVTVTMTMAASTENCTQDWDNSTCCTTDALYTNITVSCSSVYRYKN